MDERFAGLKDAVCRANKKLAALGLVTGSFGNVSGADRGLGIMAIKPSGVDYGELTPDTIVVMDLDGKILEGDLRPSSDTKTHLGLYRAFPEIGGVVHTHSTYATSWAQARRPLPCLGTTHADYFRGPVPCTAVIPDASIARDYEAETAVQIVETFRGADYRDMPAVLVACHGPFAWGAGPAEAVHNAHMLEFAAEMALYSLEINPRVGGGIKRTLLDKHYLRKHGPTAYYGQK